MLRSAFRVAVSVLATAGVLGLAPARATAAAVKTPSAPAPHRRVGRPNVLFVLADDLDAAEMRYLPHVEALIGEHGATFDRYYVSNSLCCPSRATTLRGQYSHNDGVWTNGGDNGGFEKAYSSGLEEDTVATRLHRAGYLTSLVGKYLNGYPNRAPTDYLPPGWSNFTSAVSGNPYAEYRYVLNDNGAEQVHGKRPADYGTTVYTRATAQFIRRAARAHRPFFADLSVYAPHQPATPARQDRRKFAGATAPHTPSYDQPDVSRMPTFVRDLPRFTPLETAAINRLYRKRIRSLQAVDRAVVHLVRTLRATHELHRTYIVFASDNGFHLGQHRLPAGKRTAYETDIRVPLLVRGPGIEPGTHVSRIAGNTDLAPTFEAMSGVSPPTFTDGRSLVPLLRGRAPSRWRHAYLVEHRNETGTAPAGRPAPDEPSPLEPPDPEQVVTSLPLNRRGVRDSELLKRLGKVPEYAAVRTTRYLYVEYVTGDRELYDTSTDPDEIDNLAGRAPAGLQHSLATRLHQLERCHAASCRRIEDRRVP
jgi:N-acetylglucosamine-6-sulfatase